MDWSESVLTIFLILSITTLAIVLVVLHTFRRVVRVITRPISRRLSRR